MNKKLIFVIHEHHASHLHYDLRLEKDGVLKSWAVPKEPPKEIGIKRLAVQVEDHPLDYAGFEGEIPEGQYGAGLVEIWDKGYYIPSKFNNSEIIFELKGEKLKGTYCLIKLKNSEKNWLFFKRNKRNGK
jgi:DNA ligase D-like protein (predicted 3'-phosphoesterase)